MFRAGAAIALLCCISAAVAQDVMPVRVATPSTEEAVQRVSLTGSVRARRAAAVSPRLPGLVDTVVVDAGDAVAAGDVLVRLDDRLAELAVARAEAAVHESRTALDEARRLREEGRRLVRDNFVPETEVRAREAAVALAEAELASAEAELETERERLRRHSVPAPFDGVVALRLVDEGEWVETGTAVVELVAADAVWLDVQAPQALWPRLDAEVDASATFDALPGRRFPARLHARVPVGDPQARTFLVRFVLDPRPADVVPGMSATVDFEFELPGRRLSVPRDALIRYPDGSTTVWIVDESGEVARAREIGVEVERVVGDRVILASGPEPDRRVVVRGNEVLGEGQRVRIVE